VDARPGPRPRPHDVATAGAILGIGRGKAYELAKSGEFPVVGAGAESTVRHDQSDQRLDRPRMTIKPLTWDLAWS
jgi:hypothetical protein